MTITVDVTRSRWENPTNPVRSDRVFSWTNIKYVCIHYVGAGKLSWKSGPEAMRAIQRDYTQNRGYSFGYSYGIHPVDALLCEGRGTTFRAASNGDDEHLDDQEPGNPKLSDNDEVVSVCVFTDGDDPAPPKVVERIRRLVAEVRAVKPNVKVVGHNNLDLTSCPGKGLGEQVSRKVFDPVQEDDMAAEYFTLKEPPARLWVTHDGGKHARWVSPEEWNAVGNPWPKVLPNRVSTCTFFMPTDARAVD